MNFYNIFAESLDTFKAFDKLVVTNVGDRLEKSPKTVWQILNHLIIWQKYQLQYLQNPLEEITFNESFSWIPGESPKHQKELDETIQIFHSQLGMLKELLHQLTFTDSLLENKLKTIQNLSSHLSFHLGEVIHLRRLVGEYPQPEQMRDFLLQNE